MKKLMMLALGLGLVAGSVSFAAPQDTTTKTDDTKMAKKKHHKKAKKDKTATSTDKKM